MKDNCEEQAEYAVWINKEEQIVTFRETEGFKKLSFRTQEEKMHCICSLCESGYRIL